MNGRATVVLVRHSLRRSRGILVGLGVLLAAFQFLLTQMGAYLVRHSAFGELSLLMPDFVRNIAGPSALAFMSFSGIVALGYFHPIVIAAAIGVTIAIGSEPASEIEMRFVDLTLSRDLTRTALVTRTCLVFAIAAAWILGMMMAGTLTGLRCCAPPDVAAPRLATIASLAASLAALMACWAGVTLAVAAAARRRAVVGALVGVAALATFLLDYIARAWEPARGSGVLSPFHYFEPTALLLGAPLNTFDLAVLVGVGGMGIAIAYIVFARRDI